METIRHFFSSLLPSSVKMLIWVMPVAVSHRAVVSEQLDDSPETKNEFAAGGSVGRGLQSGTDIQGTMRSTDHHNITYCWQT